MLTCYLLPFGLFLPLAGMVQDLKMDIHLFPGNQRNYLVQVIQPMYSYLKEEMQKKNAAGALAEHVYKKVPPARPPFPAVFLLLIKLVVSPLPPSPGARAARWQNYDDINEYFWTEGCIKKEHSMRLDAQYVKPETPDEEKKSKLEIWCAHHLSSSEGAGKSEPMF